MMLHIADSATGLDGQLIEVRPPVARRLVDDLLGVARLEAHRNRAPTDLSSIARPARRRRSTAGADGDNHPERRRRYHRDR